jgi:hypothetical protein
MINPIVAFTWGAITLVMMIRERAWKQFGIAAAIAFLTLCPWLVRNYLVFGRLIPVKSNAAYELYQSQCLQEDGLLQAKVFGQHPWVSSGRERQEYKRLGEMAFLDQKREIFTKSVKADPVDFLERVSARFLGATVWYMPGNRAEVTQRPVMMWTSRVLHPLPFLAFLVLGFSAIFQRLSWPQWAVMGLYVVYLLPYVAVSYYDRYAMPLLAVKAMLVIWAADRLLCLIPWGKKEPEAVAAVAEEEPVDAVV